MSIIKESVTTDTPATGPAGNAWFYGWAIAVASALGIGSGISVYLPTTTGLLVGPLGADLHWTPPQIYLALTFATGATILIAPFLGRLVDQFGARRIIAFSFIAQALLIGSCRYLDDDIRAFYARYAAFALLSTGTTAIAFSALISRWFSRRRGLALGIGLAGLGLGGVFWSLLTQWLFQHFGWREAFTWMAGIIALGVLPLLLLVLRNSPESMGLNPDGDKTPSAAVRRDAATGLSLREAMSTRVYWLMMITFFLVASAAYGVMLNMVPLLEHQGASRQYAVAAQASIWLALVLGRVITGWFLDRFFAARVAQVFMLPPIVGVALLAVGVSGPSAFVAAMLVGLAAGAEVDVLAYMVSRYFGLRHFGTIYATYFAVYAVGTSLGPLFTSSIMAHYGVYSPALWSSAGALIAGCVLLIFYPRFHNQTSPAS
jgi:MFS family permease